MMSNRVQTSIFDTWITCPKPNSQAKLRLFCLPYAGAGVAMYHPWAAHLSPEIELCLINLPGREKRLQESPYTHLDPLVEDLAEVLPKYLDKPFAFFGHSMGGLICFELTRYLRRHYALQPMHLFISARRAPQLPDPNPAFHHLPDPAFLEALQQRYGSLPDILLQAPDLMQLFLPILRADMTILETYHYHEDRVFACPISAFGGQQDQVATEEGISVWQTQTQGKFKLTMFPGDHFYLQNSYQALAKHISDDLAQLLS